VAQPPERLELAVFSSRGIAVHPLVPGKDLVVGRSDDADISIVDAAVSRRHAIFHAGPPLEIEDLGSANGTFVSAGATAGGKAAHLTTDSQHRVRATRNHLRPGDSVFFGAAVVVVRAATNVDPAAAITGLDAVVRDPVLVGVFQEAARAALLSLPVLLLGETGVGKDVLARFIHERSRRASKAFIALNCAALSESLAESELFGHERGAFTGAQQARAGLLEAASGGTVFLDEIGELPVATQAKLLRALEASEVQRLGSVKPVRVDVRVISATNRDLEADAATGRFRRDLYFRINGIALRVPPLRERTSEIGELARRFLATAARQAGIEPPAITAEAMLALELYAWPGNVRELRYVMERTLVTAGAGPIQPAHLPDHVGSSDATSRGRPDLATRERVIEALAACDGNQTRAADMLGISRRTLINRVIEFGLPRPRKG
jgi:two-component system, NtrC family, response regulator AtoC